MNPLIFASIPHHAWPLDSCRNGNRAVSQVLFKLWDDKMGNFSLKLHVFTNMGSKPNFFCRNRKSSLAFSDPLIFLGFPWLSKLIAPPSPLCQVVHIKSIMRWCWYPTRLPGRSPTILLQYHECESVHWVQQFNVNTDQINNNIHQITTLFIYHLPKTYPLLLNTKTEQLFIELFLNYLV